MRRAATDGIESFSYPVGIKDRFYAGFPCIIGTKSSDIKNADSRYYVNHPFVPGNKLIQEKT